MLIEAQVCTDGCAALAVLSVAVLPLDVCSMLLKKQVTLINP
jgi:hypothetical protein